ncbi:alpha-1-antitrypsin homolog, partial [Gymnodraco acuticeps]|uniref:Alpha-1-antitrypsin homolog n=1 Tax=Gymnodraco acuticeps TaxID=8218 RepID=A0A6P8VES5_GYMAC
TCVGPLLLLAAAWAGHHHHYGADGSHTHEEYVRWLKLSCSNADFAFALYKSLNANAAAGKNIFFSPLGISTALSMVSTGAGNRQQLFSSLGYSAHTQEQVNEAYEHLFHMMRHSEEHHQVDLGSGVAFQTGYSPLEKFQNDVKDDYFGRIFTVNFTKPAEAADDINKLIANRTNNMITDMVKDLDPRTIMMIINYVYFRGQWEEPFDANHTQLPYKGNTSMMIVLPEEGKMKEVEGYISKDYVKHWHDSVIRRSVRLSLPKFSISADASLESTLKEMDIFGKTHKSIIGLL